MISCLKKEKMGTTIDKRRENTPDLMRMALIRGDSWAWDTDGFIVDVPSGKELIAQVLCHLRRKGINAVLVYDLSPETIDRSTEGKIGFKIEMTDEQTKLLSKGTYLADIQISYDDTVITVLQLELEVKIDQSFVTE